jgi:hypothetical protein
MHIFMGFPSADKLRAKSKNAAGLCAGQGIGNFLHYRILKGLGLEAKKIPARSVFGFVRERPCAPRSISADLIFLVTFCIKTKRTSLRGN